MRIATKFDSPDQAKPSALLDGIAIFCLLLAPYLSFIRYNEFVFEGVNLILVAIFAAMAVGLVALMRLRPSPALRVAILTLVLFLFLDFQLYWINQPLLKLVIGVPVVGALCWLMRQRINFVLAAASGTIAASTLVLALWSGWTAGSQDTPASPAAGQPDLPAYVHIILDELAGPEAFDDDIPIQRAIKTEIQTFFADHGFRLYGRAYSPYYHSQDSISATLNLETTSDPSAFYEIHGDDLWITRNRYFDDLRARGYDIHVYQSTYVDFCSLDTGPIRACVTYNYDASSSAALASLSEADKARIVLIRYGNLYGLKQVAMSTYGWLRPHLARVGLSLPKPMATSGQLGPIPVLPVIARLIGDVAEESRGNAYFAHLFVPHYPYSVDANCRIRRPVLAWPSRYIAHLDDGQDSPEAKRLALYEAYIPQVRCALAKVKDVLDALKARGAYEDATIVVHGDHGSRIVRHEPITANRAGLSAQDINDGYLALYAVKSPGIAPGYDETVMALPELLQAMVRGTGRTAAAPAAAQPRIYLRTGPISGLVEIPMPCLGDVVSRAVSPATLLSGLASKCGADQARTAPAPAAAAEDG
jgi:hypothetical protein